MATILVVDDEPSIVALLQDILEDEGHRVIGAYNGRDALALVREQRPDVVVSDLMMPVMDGAQLARELHDDPTFASLSLILMSAGNTPDSVQSYAAAFIRKPFEIAAMVALIARYVA